MKNSIFIFLFVICSLLFGICRAQVAQQWVQRYNGSGNFWDESYSIAVDGSGNVYVTGQSAGSGTGYDYATIKYNSSGDTQWVARYNGPGNLDDNAISLAVDDSENVYVTGESFGNGTGLDYATIKYNSSGVQQWVSRYNGPGNNKDYARSIDIDGSGNVYVTGSSKNGSTDGTEDFATIKYNSSGVQQWASRYNGPGNAWDNASSIAVDGSGNVYVTGDSYGSGTSQDYATIKYNSSGDSLWVERYSGPGNFQDYANSIAVDTFGNVFVTGSSKVGSGFGDGNYATIKYNSAGVQQWVAIYNGPANSYDVARSLAVDGSGNVYVTGGSAGGGGIIDYATLKYNSSGVQQWVARYNGGGGNGFGAYSLAVDSSGNVYVTGVSHGISNDYATLKYNSAGIQQWVARYNGPGNAGDNATSLAIDGSGNVYVTGYSAANGQFDYATLKYSPLVGIQPVSNEIPSQYSLSQNYPNPFNPKTVISFQLAVNSFVSLKVYDILGREVTSLVNEQLEPGTYEVNWNADRYSSGVYYYQLNAGIYSETKKMVLVK